MISSTAKKLGVITATIVSLPEDELSFKFSRSSGPGGQNVNKTSTKVSLRWQPSTSTLMTRSRLERLKSKYPNLINLDGFVQIQSDRFRDQLKNISDAKEKLEAIIESVWSPPKKRKATKPSRGSVEARLSGKKIRAKHKKARQKIDSSY